MTCQNCQHWLPKESGQMAKHGFAICANKPRYVYWPPQHTCGKFAKADQKVVNARAVWLTKLGGVNDKAKT